MGVLGIGKLEARLPLGDCVDMPEFHSSPYPSQPSTKGSKLIVLIASVSLTTALTAILFYKLGMTHTMRRLELMALRYVVSKAMQDESEDEYCEECGDHHEPDMYEWNGQWTEDNL